MILAVFFGSVTWTDLAPISAAMDALIGTADVDGRRAGLRASSNETELERAADGALGVVHSGARVGVPWLADEEARRRGFIPTVVPADETVAWLLDRWVADPALLPVGRCFGVDRGLVDALWAVGIETEWIP